MADTMDTELPGNAITSQGGVASEALISNLGIQMSVIMRGC
jgi:hypothetical protein